MRKSKKNLENDIIAVNTLYAYFQGCTDSKDMVAPEITYNEEQYDMTFTKRKDGRYTKSITINHQRHFIYGNTQKECYTKYIALKKEIKDKYIKFTTTTKCIDWLRYWFDNFKKPFVSIDTQKEIKRIIEDKLSHFHKKALNKINTLELQEYFNKMDKSRTKEKIILYFKASLDKAVDLGKIKSNPFNAYIKDKKINNVRPPFTYQEQCIILDRIKNERIYAGIIIYLITGLRKEELDIKNLENNLDITSKTLKAENLKQREDEPQYKYIDLSDNAVSFITDNMLNLKSMTTEYIYRQFKLILDELGIKGSIHTLRHTFATNHMYLGTPIKMISTWLGHSTTQITQDIYIALDKNITKENINKLYNNLYLNF